MASPVPLRTDFDAGALRREARRSRDAAQARRLLALAAIYDGGSRSDAARVGGVTLQIVRDWALRFNAEGPAGLMDRKAPGAASKLDDTQRRAVAEIVETGPTPGVHGVVRWRLADLAGWVGPSPAPLASQDRPPSAPSATSPASSSGTLLSPPDATPVSSYS